MFYDEGDTYVGLEVFEEVLPVPRFLDSLESWIFPVLPTNKLILADHINQTKPWMHKFFLKIS